MKKLFIFLILGILLATPLISATDWDNKLYYSENDLKVTLKNSFLLLFPTSKIGTIELKSHSSVNEIRKVGAGSQVVMWYDFNFVELYSNGLGEVEFTDMRTGEEIERDYSFVYWGEKEKDVYGQGKCFFSINGTQTCETIVVGKETYNAWLPYNSKDIPKGNIRIGLITYVEIKDKVDGVWTIAGKKVSRHARWTQGLDVGLVSYYKLDDTSGDAIDSHGLNDGTVVGVTYNVSGIINTAYDFDGDPDYVDTFQLPSGEFSISLWVNADSFAGNSRIFDGKESGENRGFRAYILADGKVQVDVYDGTTSSAVTTSTGLSLTAGWQHFVITSNSDGDLNVSINDTNVGSDSTGSGYIKPGDTTKIRLGDSPASGAPFNGQLDEVGIWNRSLTPTEKTQLYNDGVGISPGARELAITLLSPEDTLNFTTNIINFSANVSDIDVVGIQNVSLLIDGVINQTNTSGIEGIYNWTGISFVDGDYNWTVIAYDDANNLWETGTRSITIDTYPPIVNILSPIGGLYHKSGSNLTLNWTAVDLNLNICWYSYRGTNTTVTCGDNSTNIFNITNISATFLIFYANDTSGNLGLDTTTWFYHSWEYDRTFNNITYETENETYNIKINSTTPTNPKFFYDDVEYPTTVTPLGENNFSISKTFDIPTISSEINKTFYFQWNVGVNEIISETSNQTIKVINFTRCFTGTPYLNFTFKDETDDSVLNASNDLIDVDYWLGSGTKEKSYITSNSTEDYDYAFCFLPSDRDVIMDLIFKYSKSGYPLRTFTYNNQELSNDTLDKTLYLLSTTDGIYSSISVIESSGASIEGVIIQIERQFGGVWTLISQDVTGSDGVATFWVNPNFQHRITATKTNYVATQVTITPSQTLYTLTMQRTTAEAEYDSDIPGIKWVAYPQSGTIPPGIRSFNITVTSSESNLENCKFELVNATNLSHVLDSVIDITNSSYCFLNIDYNAQENSKFFGRLSLDTTETTGYIIVNADWKWIVIERDVKGWRTITSFFADLTTLSEFGEGNEAEFSRIVTFFLIATIIFGVFIYFSGVELNSPGITILLIWGITLFASAGGFLTFYSGSSNVNPIIEQYGFFFIFTIYMINYFMTIIRRANE